MIDKNIEIVNSALIVEDDPKLLRTLLRVLSEYIDDVRTARNVKMAVETLATWRPDILLIDVKLPDGDALDVLNSARKLSSLPRMVAMSAHADATDGLALGKLGVSMFLKKPFDLKNVEAVLAAAFQTEPDLQPIIRSAVGSTGLKTVETHVRNAMIDEALMRTGGSRRGAARLLKVSRQFLQHALRA